jgi:hypothetical protein
VPRHSAQLAATRGRGHRRPSRRLARGRGPGPGIHRGESSGTRALFHHGIRAVSTRGAPARRGSHRFPQQRLGLPHAQRGRRRPAAAEGPGPLPAQLRGRAGGGDVRGRGRIRAGCIRPGRFIDVSKQQVLASRIDYVLGQMVAGDLPVRHREDRVRSRRTRGYLSLPGRVRLHLDVRARALESPARVAGRSGLDGVLSGALAGARVHAGARGAVPFPHRRSGSARRTSTRRRRLRRSSGSPSSR